jgi:hypothetical protein
VLVEVSEPVHQLLVFTILFVLQVAKVTPNEGCYDQEEKQPFEHRPFGFSRVRQRFALGAGKICG